MPVDELCTLVRGCLAFADDEPSVEITPDTELLALGLLDSLSIRRIVAELSAAGITVPADQIVAATFRTPTALSRVIDGLR